MGNLSFMKVTVRDLEAAADFYRQVFDLEELHRISMDDFGGVDEIVLGTGEETGAPLVLVRYRNNEIAQKGGVLGFHSADVVATVDKARAAGATVVMEPRSFDSINGQLAAAVTDPEGQTVEIVGIE